MSELFDAFGLQLPLLIAQAVNFGVLMVVLWYLLYKPVMATLETRRQKIASGVAAAEMAEAKAATADAEAAKVVHGAETEAEGIVSVARESAQSERTRIIKEAEARAASVEKDAEARAKEDAARLLRDSEKEIARLSVLAAEKVIRSK
ncbi:MAG: F0F1 ATP synthase subunit B [Patescibacteria group bacterium]